MTRSTITPTRSCCQFSSFSPPSPYPESPSALDNRSPKGNAGPSVLVGRSASCQAAFVIVSGAQGFRNAESELKAGAVPAGSPSAKDMSFSGHLELAM